MKLEKTMSKLFTQQSTVPELFKTGEDIAEELKAQTVEPKFYFGSTRILCSAEIAIWLYWKRNVYTFWKSLVG